MRLLRSRFCLRLLSVPGMLLLVLIVHRLGLPSSALLLMLPVAFLAYADGYVGGALSGLPVLGYICFEAFRGSADPAAPAITALSLTGMVLLTGRFRADHLQCIASMEEQNEALSHLAVTDRLTGVSNRQGFFDLAEAAYQSGSRQKSPLAVLFIDADRFKAVNDAWGHSFGDRVLRQLSEIIRACLRSSDLCCRYGGEEFLILLPQADQAAAEAVAQRIMEQVRALRFSDCPDFHCTVSIGISAGTPSPAHHLEDFISDADCAMYQAKQTGRDRVVLRLLDGAPAPP